MAVASMPLSRQMCLARNRTAPCRFAPAAARGTFCFAEGRRQQAGEWPPTTRALAREGLAYEWEVRVRKDEQPISNVVADTGRTGESIATIVPPSSCRSTGRCVSRIPSEEITLTPSKTGPMRDGSGLKLALPHGPPLQRCGDVCGFTATR